MRQPLLLNHDGKNIPEILGLTIETFEEEANKWDVTNPEDDDKILASTILAAFEMMPKSTRSLVGLIFQIIYGEEVEKVSHMVEKIVNANPTEEQQKMFMTIVGSEILSGKDFE